MKLYDYEGAPSPRRVRIFIAEKGIEIPTVQVDLAAKAQHETEFDKVNRHRTVPVLELDDGSRLTNTAGIYAYLEALHPDPSLLGETPEEKGRIAECSWRIENEGYMAVAEAFRNKAKGFVDHALPGPVEYAQIPDLIERGLARTQNFFKDLDESLADREFITGERYTMADITALVTIDFAEWMKQTLPESAPHARRWYDLVSNRPSASA